MESNPNGTRTWQWVVTIIVIIVLIIIGILVFGGKKTADVPVTTDDNTPTTTDTIASANRIVMSDQYPGNVVYLSSVQMGQPGWVEVHADANGQPGAIIGSTYFDKGINPGKVTLTKPMVEGGTYYAMIHTDDGDKKFDPTKDLPLKDSSGNIIMKVFHASASVGSEIKG